MAKQKNSGVASEETAIDIQDDEYRGMGGSYILDPKTGKRTRAEGLSEQPETEQPQGEALAHESE